MLTSCGADGDGAVPHAGERGKADVLAAVEHEALVLDVIVCTMRDAWSERWDAPLRRT